jgi:hypothetical protein
MDSNNPMPIEIGANVEARSIHRANSKAIKYLEKRFIARRRWRIEPYSPKH